MAAGIERAIADILPETVYMKPAGTVHLDSLFYLLKYGLGRRHHLEMKVNWTSDTEAKLTFRIVPYENEDRKYKLLVTMPEMHFCGMLDKVSVTAKEIDVLDICDGGDTVRFDSVSGTELYLYGCKVAEIDADLIYRKPRTKGVK